jgi:glutamate-1-semialdehyde 2,1-aminomutase
VAAGLETLRQLARPGVYETLETKGKRLEAGFSNVLQRYDIDGTINRCGSMMTVFFGVDQVRDADDARLCDRRRFKSFFLGMLQRGIYWPPSPFESAFVSLAHTTADLDKTIAAFAGWAREECPI